MVQTPQFPEAERQLLQALRRRERRALNVFYQELYRRSSALLQQRYLQGLPHLEDCFSEAFLAFLDKIDRPEFQPLNLYGFALTILLGKVRDRTRKRLHHFSCAPEDLPVQGVVDAVADRQLPDQFFVEANDAQYTWFQQLSPRDRELLELRLQGFPQQEIAEHFGLNYGTVRNRSRALVKKACRLATIAG